MAQQPNPFAMTGQPHGSFGNGATYGMGSTSANSMGSLQHWQGYYHTFPSRARSWRKWEERVALTIVLRYLRVKYLTDEGWDTDMCPIQSLFEPGKKVEDLS